MSAVLRITMCAYEYECAMCSNLVVLPDHRGGYAVPWDCEPVSSAVECDGYRSVCKGCYDRWSQWDDKVIAQQEQKP